MISGHLPVQESVVGLSGLFARPATSALGGKPGYRQSAPGGLEMTRTCHGRANFALTHNTPPIDDVVGCAHQEGW
jgi:hypothetical protein